ncbi:MAG: hypothetical protein K6E50_10860 [Lachnospiraceae bacterium]|nr:hypothetical protein [Lachnospiraceae bacterium]
MLQGIGIFFLIKKKKKALPIVAIVFGVLFVLFGLLWVLIDGGEPVEDGEEQQEEREKDDEDDEDEEGVHAGNLWVAPIEAVSQTTDGNGYPQYIYDNEGTVLQIQEVTPEEAEASTGPALNRRSRARTPLWKPEAAHIPIWERTSLLFLRNFAGFITLRSRSM